MKDRNHSLPNQTHSQWLCWFSTKKSNPLFSIKWSKVTLFLDSFEQKHCFLLHKGSWESAHKSNLRLGIRTRPGPDLDPTSTLYFRIDDFAWTSINFHAICFQSRPWRPFAIDSNQVFLAFECDDQLVVKIHFCRV